MKKDSTTLAQYVAFNAHFGQFRRDGKTPYYNHVYKVALNLAKESKEVIAVGYLHDVLEDTKVTKNDLINYGIPQVVIDAVVILTHNNNEPYVDYLKAIKNNPIARKVKIADMLSNLADSPTKNQIKKYAKGLLFLID